MTVDLIPETKVIQFAAIAVDFPAIRSAPDEVELPVELPDTENNVKPAAPPRAASIRIERQSVGVTFSQERLTEALTLELIQIPGGDFEMGSPETERFRGAAEGPQHRVKLSDFWMGQYPVTQAEWRAVAEFPAINRTLKSCPSNFQGDRLPVEQVSWYDAVEFCDRLAAHTGRPYRLPTEAEWEYACRAGTKTPFYFGEFISTEIANYFDGDDIYGLGLGGEYRRQTTPVDHECFRAANRFGLCDMHGNVLEWCLDHWHENYEGAPIDGSAWTTDEEDFYCVLRGGSWGGDPGYCRSAARILSAPEGIGNSIGFRVALGLQSPLR
ncbi:MAG: formylglycine-generating enzyme family protein [Leptolyngbyaceae cyanobacterium MO_188.B28]|nr:formylglycine-generating enzyme family protein [Leptolyngbyaceae cyanobacterium MO_188.B28]